MENIEAKRAQVIAQCKVVAHLAQAMADLHTDLATAYASPACDPILNMAGNRTAQFMEDMGNWLSNMDAVEEGDEWTAPIYEAAHRMFPQRAVTAQHREEQDDA